MDEWQKYTKALARTRLKELGMTIRSFAKHWDIHESHVSAVLNGTTKTRRVMAGQRSRIQKYLCKTLGFSWSELWEPELWQYTNKPIKKKEPKK